MLSGMDREVVNVAWAGLSSWIMHWITQPFAICDLKSSSGSDSPNAAMQVAFSVLQGADI